MHYLWYLANANEWYEGYSIYGNGANYGYMYGDGYGYGMANGESYGYGEVIVSTENYGPGPSYEY